MTRIKHRRNYINIFGKHFNVLPCARSAAVPAVCSVNIDRNRCIDVCTRVRQKRNKRAFFIHAFAFPAVRSIIQIVAVCRETYIVKLNFIETARYKLFCDCDIVFPYFRRIRIDPIFIVVKCFFTYYVSRIFINNIFVFFDSHPWTL